MKTVVLIKSDNVLSN